MKFKTIDISKIEKNAILQKEESFFLDFKAKEISPAKLTKTISAFCNSSGGEVYIGISDDKEWNGFITQEDANDIVSTTSSLSSLSNHCVFEFLYLPNEISCGKVLLITAFKTSEIIFATDGEAYKRVNASTQKMDKEQIEALKFSKGIISFEDHALDVPFNILTESAYLKDFMKNVVPTNANPYEWLFKQRLIREECPTVAGVLLFSEEPQVDLPKRSSVKIFRYASAGEAERDTLQFDPFTIEGPVVDVINKSVKKVIELITDIKILTDKGMVRAKYPQEAIHEIVTNMILHRDYSLTKDCQIRIFDNRIEFESPGKLPGYITIKNILVEQFARNPKMVRLVNKFPSPPNKDVGEGLNTAFELMRKVRLKDPLIKESENSVIVILPHESLQSPINLIVSYLENNQEITNAIARKLTGERSENKIKSYFQKLRAQNIIEPVPGRSVFSSAWKLKLNKKK